MAKFTRKEIREIIGEACTDEIENKIMALYLGVIDPMKDELAKYKAAAERLEVVQKELDERKANPGEDYKAKYEKEHSDFEAFKKDVTEKETKTAKEAAVKAYFEGKNITGANLAIAMRGARDEINAVVLDGEKIKDTAALDALVSGEFSGLVVTKTTQGTQTATPPANTGGAKLTKADIYKRDEHGRYVMSTADRQKALAENPELLK